MLETDGEHSVFDCYAHKIISYLLSFCLGRLAIVLDPPFGGLVSLISKSLQKFAQTWRDANSIGKIFNLLFQFKPTKTIVKSCRRNPASANILDFSLLHGVADSE